MHCRDKKIGVGTQDLGKVSPHRLLTSYFPRYVLRKWQKECFGGDESVAALWYNGRTMYSKKENMEYGQKEGRSVRLTRITQYLHSHRRGLTARELAELCGVSVRTMNLLK